jgi:methionyl-tRNA formyltransferase
VNLNINMNYTFAFLGSDEFSIIVLEELIQAGYRPSLCITQPDKPKGRKLVLTPTPIKEFCIAKNIPYITPEKLVTEEITSLNTEYDFFVVASYGKIISQSILDIPKYGCLNVHPSLLPQYRGASPIEAAILNDTKDTGVTIMLMDAQMDHGPIIKQAEYLFEEWPKSKQIVHDTLAHLGGRILAEVIQPFVQGDIVFTEQDHEQATFTKMIKKEDGRINLEDTSYEIYLKYLALTPWPGLFFFIQKDGRELRIKIESAHFDKVKGFVIDTIIPEGKGSMDCKSFENGYLK